MQASIKWLKDYVDFTQSPEELAEILTMAGVPVEGIRYLGENLDEVVTGFVEAIEHHPNADKLWICTIDVKSEKLTIVTGAQNVQQGHIVPVAKVGAKLPTGLKIKPAKLRGVESFGMLCSATELNLDTKLLSAAAREGIFILPQDTPIGIDIKEALGLDDVILEFELTANRADCFSMIGLAREIAVLTGGTLKRPMLTIKEKGTEKAAALINVEIAEPSLCSRFTARVLKNVKVGPSPLWLKRKIESAGIRSINNVVDVTNFVMLEMGQPMHAYDYSLLSRQKLIVRKAHDEEPLTTLDGQKRQLKSEMLVIADEGQAVGVAGVMGGLATEVTFNTKTVLLEAASFNSASVRRTARALGLRSEASGRFERGVDTANIINALDRAANLLEDMEAATVCPGVVDVYPHVMLPKQISFTSESINKRLGAEITATAMMNILRNLGFEVEAKSEKILVTVPTWRNDVTGMADLSEEIARIYGYENILPAVPSGLMLRGGQDYISTLAENIRTILVANGLDEVINFSFTNSEVMEKLNMPVNDENKAINILNPITDEFPLMRTELLAGIMETIVRNVSRKNEDLQIFELGAVYKAQALPLTEFPQEPLMLCGALTGSRNELSWNQARTEIDFYDVKGTVENLLSGLGINKYQVVTGTHPSLHPGKTALLTVNDVVLGVIGELHPKVLDAFGLAKKVCIFSMDVANLAKFATAQGHYQSLPKYPATSRDLAMVLSKDIQASDVAHAIQQSGGEYLRNVTLFDVYEGEQVGTGLKSLAYALVFQANDRTLRDEEVDVFIKSITVHLESTLSAKLRS